MKKVMSWGDVRQLHGTVSAVSYENSKIKSLLSGNSNYSDEIKGEFLKYSVPNRRHYKKLMIKFNDLLDEKKSIIVYYKIRSNEWINLGNFIVSSIEVTDNTNIIFLKLIDE